MTENAASHSEPRIKPLLSRSWRLILILLVIGWTLAIAAGVVWNLRRDYRDTAEVALVQARIFAQKIAAYRHWNASHGGIYVEVTERTRPNPHLAHLPERDVVTPSGRTLTMVNPAYMVREITELERRLYGLQGRITSLDPINPQNRPDPWEREGLQRLAAGAAEVSTIVGEAKQERLRLLLPLRVEKVCLTCHASQGYRVGQLRGGLSVAVPMQPLWSLGGTHRLTATAGAAALWLGGLIILRFGALRMRAQRLQNLQAEERLESLACRDEVTGLSTRLLMNGRIGLSLEQSRRGRAIIAVALVDIDGFRKINQALGRSAGDELLAALGRQLVALVGEQGEVGHGGAGSFPVLLPYVRHAAEAAQIAARLVEGLRRPFFVQRREIYVTVSCGIALYPENGRDPETLLQNAESALQPAKAGGGNSYRFFSSSLNVQAQQRLVLEHDLRGALERGEFILHYQPQISLDSKKVCGAEALLRWQHPRRGLLYPGQFIDVAEESGMICEIGSLVLEAACKELARWRAGGITDLPLAVNLSARQFQDDTLIEAVAAILENHSVPARSLVLEITESSLMENVERAQDILSRLRAMGVRIAIDDFGTGYSSLSYLQSLSADTLKIDRSFIARITSENGAALFGAMVTLARNLSLDVVGEGVENFVQEKALQAAGCDKAQGFLYSHALSGKDFCQFVHLLRTQPCRPSESRYNIEECEIISGGSP